MDIRHLQSLPNSPNWDMVSYWIWSSRIRQIQGCFLSHSELGQDAQHAQPFSLFGCFMEVLKIQSKVLMIIQQALHQLSHLPSLQYYFCKTKHIKVNQRINFHFTCLFLIHYPADLKILFILNGSWSLQYLMPLFIRIFCHSSASSSHHWTLKIPNNISWV